MNKPNNPPEWMPQSVYSACRNREHSREEVSNFTPRQAIGQYAGWHLGDPDWGHEFFDLIEAMLAEREKSS